MAAEPGQGIKDIPPGEQGHGREQARRRLQLQALGAQARGILAPGWRAQPATTCTSRRARRTSPKTAAPKWCCAQASGSQKMVAIDMSLKYGQAPKKRRPTGRHFSKNVGKDKPV